MTCDPFVYISNQEGGSVDTNGNVPLGNIVHKTCSQCDLSGDSILCRGVGAFEATGTITISQTDISGSTPPILTIGLFKNEHKLIDSVVSGNSSGTVTFPLHTVFRNTGSEAAVLTVKNLGPEFDLVNINLLVKPVK